MNYNEHRAIVTNNEDPDILGRLKVKCASLLDEEQELPLWIPPRFHFVGLAADPSGNVIGCGWFGIPAIDTWVDLMVPEESRWDEVPWEQSLEMEGGGIHWKCTTYNDVQKIPEIFKTNYPFRSGYVWPNGWTIFVDSKVDEMTMGYVPDGKTPEAWFKILKDHTIIAENSDGMKIHLLPTKILVEATGGPVEIVGDNIKLGGAAATEHIPYGDILKTYLTTEQAAFGTTHTHVCAAPGAPSGPPVPIMNPVPGNLLSTKHTVE